MRRNFNARRATHYKSWCAWKHRQTMTNVSRHSALVAELLNREGKFALKYLRVGGSTAKAGRWAQTKIVSRFQLQKQSRLFAWE
jgi:hypothetical protein